MKIYIETNKLDIIAITEVFPKNSVFDCTLKEMYKMGGYDCFFGKNGKRGAVICTKKGLRANLVEEPVEFEESVWIEVDLVNNDRLLIGCIYKSPISSGENVDKMYEMVGYMCALNYSHFLAIRDFDFKNTDLEHVASVSGELQPETEFVEKIKDLFLFQHVTEATRFREGSEPSILDLVFTNEEDMINNFVFHNSLGKSDHLSLIFDYICYKVIKSDETLRFNYSKANFASIGEDMNMIEGSVTSNIGTQMSWEIFVNNITKSVDKNVPKKNS